MLKLPVILLPPTLKVDGSATLKMATRELTNDEVGEIRDHRNLEGWMVFAENQVSEQDVPTVPAQVEHKTPSQRLRATLFVYWKQAGFSEDFELFYMKKMNEIIDHFQQKLDL